MWYPPDSDEPTSELYRLLPPRRKPSQLQEALDAAHGTGMPDDAGELVVPSRRWWRELAARARPGSRRATGWALGLFTATAAVVIGSLIYSWLSSN